MTMMLRVVLLTVFQFACIRSAPEVLPVPGKDQFRVQLDRQVKADIKPTYCANLKASKLAVDDDVSGSCCEGREDSCSTTYEDTVCYCDSFCDREVPDCCPDYWTHCTGVPRNPKEPAHDESYDPEASSHPDDEPPNEIVSEIQNSCLRDGVPFDVGDLVIVDCNECSCLLLENLKESAWACTEKVCGITQTQIDRVNADKEQIGWQAASYQEFAGKSLDQLIDQNLGTQLPVEGTEDMAGIKVHVKDDADLLEEFDARKKWPGLISTPQNQAQCGASWAFSTVSVASDRLAIHSAGSVVVPLSAQQLISCVGGHQHGQTGCHPVSFDRAWWYARKTGLVLESCYPYSSDRGSQGHCLLPRSHADLMTSSCPSGNGEKLSVYRASPLYKIEPTEREIMKEIVDNGPVQAMMIARDDFYTYKSGVYQSTLPIVDDPEQILRRIHSVKIIGWGVEESENGPRKFWLCANSWGENWGEDGHFRIVRGTNESAIETLIVGVWMHGSSKHHKHHQQHQPKHVEAETGVAAENDDEQLKEHHLNNGSRKRFRRNKHTRRSLDVHN